jgi:hypothetical protein
VSTPEGKGEAVVALAWYKPSQWQRLKDISADAAELEGSYEEWKTHAVRAINRARALGRRIEKVEVDVEELLAWSRDLDLPVTSGTRAQYAAEKLGEKYGGQEGRG